MRAALAVAVACGSRHALMLHASPGAQVVKPDGGGAALTTPPAGEARGATLANGWPVWIVAHDDGTFSVLDAVVTRPHYPQPLTTPEPTEQAVVSWIPGVRRFRAGNVLFDDHGRALGYGDYDACLDACEQIEDQPKQLVSLDAFAVEPGPGVVRVGARISGAPREAAPAWLPWRRADARDQDLHDAQRPPVPVRSLADAMAAPAGTYAIVEGQIVRSTMAEPIVCEMVGHLGWCEGCGPLQVPLAGVPGGEGAFATGGTFVRGDIGLWLVRRDGRGFVLVAAGRYDGLCSQ
jgi:hypothetical protein